jgi:hypothetical protein
MDHNLIQRQQDYILERKLISIHSEDRDIKKWPNSNHFEITFPEPMLNLQSIRLLNILLPVNYYSFSSTLQNTKMFFSMIPLNDISSTNPILYADMSNSVVTPFEITIQDGFYTPVQLAIEVQNKLNSTLQAIDPTFNYNFFRTYYDSVAHKIWIGNQRGDGFNLEFQLQSLYTIPNNDNTIAFKQYTKWGLGFYLGYDKQKYTSIQDTSNVVVSYESSILNPHLPLIWLDASSNPVNYIKPPYTLKLNGDRCIYLEVNKYNSYDELYPYSQATSNVFLNDYAGKVNSAFAKIMITETPFTELFDSTNGFISNMKYFNPPLERLSKLEFKFRYHDGKLVDFQQQPFHFTIEIVSYRNEIGKTYNVRTPLSVPFYS